MTGAANRLARVRSLVTAFNDHEVARMAQHVATTVVWSRGDGTSLKGRDTLAARLEALFAAFPDASLTATRMLTVEPHAVVVEWVLEGTQLGDWRVPGREKPIAATSRTVRVVGADLLRFNPAGEIVVDEARIDVATMLTQIGAPPASTPDPGRLREFARRYTAAWCGQDAASVAAFYSPDGSLSVNAGAPAVGPAAITEVAQAFMRDFPDMQVLMDDLLVQGDRAVYQWTLRGTNTGPGGTGRRVRISGYEVWRIGADGLIAESRGYYDSSAYQRQVEHGVEDAGP
jgi:predicted ester cyclase